MEDIRCPRCNSEDVEINLINKSNFKNLIVILIVVILFIMPILAYFLSYYFSIPVESIYAVVSITGIGLLIREVRNRHNYCKQCLFKWDPKRGKRIK